jgi:hypothetical protein
MSAIDSSLATTIAQRVEHRNPLIPPNGKTINTYLPMELLREIFLYSIESYQMGSRQLASVCRHWRSPITSIANL